MLQIKYGGFSRHLQESCQPCQPVGRFCLVSRRRTGSAQVSAQTKEARFKLADGTTLETVTAKAKGETKHSLLFIHGAGHGAWCWKGFMDHFAERGFPTYSLSLRGQAGSDVPEGAKYGGTLLQHAQDVSEYIKHEIKQPVIPVGHSFGGLIVQRYLTKEHETRVPLSGAILLASAPPSGNFGMIKRMFLKTPLVAIKTTWYFIRKSYLKNAEAVKWLFFSKDLPDEHLQQYFKQLVDNQSKIPAVSVSQLKEELKDLGQPSRLPTLVLGGQDDIIIDAEGVEETGQYYGVTPITIPNMAHDMMIDTRWEDTAREMLKWLEAL